MDSFEDRIYNIQFLFLSDDHANWSCHGGFVAFAEKAVILIIVSYIYMWRVSENTGHLCLVDDEDVLLLLFDVAEIMSKNPFALVVARSRWYLSSQFKLMPWHVALRPLEIRGGFPRALLGELNPGVLLPITPGVCG